MTLDLGPGVSVCSALLVLLALGGATAEKARAYLQHHLKACEGRLNPTAASCRVSRRSLTKLLQKADLVAYAAALRDEHGHRDRTRTKERKKRHSM